MIRLRPLTAMILGDDPDQVKHLCQFLGTRDDLTLEYDGRDVKEAEKWLKKRNCNIVFIDINGLGRKLIDFAREAISESLIILTASSDKFAIECYEIGVIDYLMKPFTRERLDKSIERAKIIHFARIGKLRNGFDIMEKFNAFYDKLQNEYRLTDNNYEICKLIIKDRNRREIMEALNISENTLKVYLRNIYSKTIESEENYSAHRKNKFHQLYLFLKREFDKNNID